MTKEKLMFKVKAFMRVGVICICMLFPMIVAGCAKTEEPETSVSKTEEITSKEIEETVVEAVTELEEKENEEIQDSDDLDTPLLGVIDGYVYRNYYFDVIYIGDDEYEFTDQAEMDEANNLTDKDSFDTEEDMRNVVNSRPNGYHDMMSISSDGSNVNVMIVPTKSLNLGREVTEDDIINYLMSIKDQLKSVLNLQYRLQGMNLESVEFDVTQQELMGETHKGIYIESSLGYQGKYFEQKQFMTFLVNGNYYFQATFTYQDDSQLDYMLDSFVRLSQAEEILAGIDRDSIGTEDYSGSTYFMANGEGCFSIPEGWKQKPLSIADDDSIEAKFEKEASGDEPTTILFSCLDLYELLMADDDFKDSGIMRSDVNGDLFSIDDILSMFSTSAVTTSNKQEREIGTRKCFGFDMTFFESRHVEVLIEDGYMYMFELFDNDSQLNVINIDNKEAVYDMIKSIVFD